MIQPRLSERHVGAVAFSRTGDPDLGQFDRIEIVAVFGEVPEILSEL